MVFVDLVFGAVSSVCRSLSCLLGASSEVEAAFHVVSDGGKRDLQTCFRQASPSHAGQAVTSLHSSEDLFDPSPDRMNGAVDLCKHCVRFVLVPGPNARLNHARLAALVGNRFFERSAPIRAVGENIAGFVGDDLLTRFAVIDIGRRCPEGFNERRTNIRRHMGFTSMTRFPAFVFNLARFIVVLAGAVDDRCVDQRARIDFNMTRFQLRRDARKQVIAETAFEKRLPEPHKRRAFRHRFAA